MLSRTSRYKPGATSVSHAIYCTSASGGVVTDVTAQCIAAATSVYGAVVFVVLLAIALPATIFIMRKVGEARDDIQSAASSFTRSSLSRAGWRSSPVSLQNLGRSPQPPGDAAQRLANLMTLRDGGLITDADYEQKKWEILGDL